MMTEELIEKWAPVLTKDLYDVGALGKTLRYQKIIDRYGRPFAHSDLFIILNAVAEQEFDKHNILLSVLAVRNHGVCRPSNEGFRMVINWGLARHIGLSFDDICKMEKQRVLDFIREQKEKERLKRWPPHNLW